MKIQAKARQIWERMDETQRTSFRLGRFPAEVMQEAEAEGYNSKEMCVALVQIAIKKGGMID